MINFLGLMNGIISGVEDTVRKVGFWFVEVLYPLISKFYESFELIARHKFFSNKLTLNNIINNIYIVVVVVIIFLFSIKLLTSIINPDMLTDKKKGVSSMAIRTIVGIILIALIPWAFDEAYDLQDLVLSKSIIQKIVFNGNGIDLDDSKNVIYSYALQTVVEPQYNVLDYDPDVDYEEGLSENLTINMIGSLITMDPNVVVDSMNAISEYEMAVCAVNYVNAAQDPKQLKNFSPCITSRFGASEESDYIFKFSGILGIILGFYLSYEMLLLCIDMALRTVKLAFLQILSPLVVCGYIFSGDVLQKWVKEVLSTYILLFVKLAAVSVMVFGISLIPEFISRSSFSNQATLVKVLLIIGLLQLIKQLPGLINTIFGTDIKSKGGIKGRLNDMAGVGKIASEAWSKLGGKAKGLGKTLALAPVGAAGAGIKKGWKNLAQKDSLAGNFAAKVNQAMNGKTGRVLRTLKAGVNSNGKDTGKALTEAWNKDAETQSSRTEERNEIVRKRNEKNNMNLAGTGTVFKDANGKPSVILNQPYQIPVEIKKITRNDGESDEDFAKRLDEFNKQVDARNDLTIKGKIQYHMAKKKQLEMDLTNAMKNIDSNTSIGASAKGYLKKYYSLLEKKNKLTEAKSNQDNAFAILESAKNNIVAMSRGDKESEEIKIKIEGLIGAMKGNGFYTKSLEQQLDTLKEFKNIIDPASFGDLEESIVNFNNYTEGLNAKGSAAIGKEVETIEKEVDNTSKVIDEYKKGLKSEYDKSELEAYKNILDVKVNEKVKNDAELEYSKTDAAKRYYYQNKE